MTNPGPLRLDSFDIGSEARESLASIDFDDDDYFHHFEDDDDHHVDEIEINDEHFSKEKKMKWSKMVKKLPHKVVVKWPKKLLGLQDVKHAERKAVLLEAQELGQTEQGKINANRNIIVVYNPISGAGIAKKLVDHMVEPVLRLAGCKVTVVATEYRGFAIEYMLKLDVSKYDGLLIAGGDGLVHEVVTGYFRRPDWESIDLPLGLVPSGTANAMAHELHAHDSKSHVALVGRAALSCAKGNRRGVDVLKCKFGDKVEDSIYALSVFGWGLAGTVAKTADDLRWIPGQKGFRYDLAGFVSMLKDWPPVCAASIEYPLEDGTIKQEDIKFVNITATNLPWLGVDHPMTQDVTPDDGYLVVSWVPASVSRAKIVKMGLQMKSGAFLMEHKAVRTIKVPKFTLKMSPEQKTHIDMLIDGDPYEPRDVEITILHQGLTVFADEKTVNGPLMVKRRETKKILRHQPLTPTSPAAPIRSFSVAVDDVTVDDYHHEDHVSTTVAHPHDEGTTITQIKNSKRVIEVLYTWV